MCSAAESVQILSRRRIKWHHLSKYYIRLVWVINFNRSVLTRINKSKVGIAFSNWVACHVGKWVPTSQGTAVDT